MAKPKRRQPRSAPATPLSLKVGDTIRDERTGKNYVVRAVVNSQAKLYGKHSVGVESIIAQILAGGGRP